MNWYSILAIVGIILILGLVVYTVYGGSATVCSGDQIQCGLKCYEPCTNGEAFNASCVCTAPDTIMYTCNPDSTLPICSISSCDPTSDDDCYQGMGSCSANCYMTSDSYYLYNAGTNQSDLMFKTYDTSTIGLPTEPYLDALQSSLVLCDNTNPVSRTKAIYCFGENTNAVCSNLEDNSEELISEMLKRSSISGREQRLNSGVATGPVVAETTWDTPLETPEKVSVDCDGKITAVSSSTYSYYGVNYSSRCVQFKCSRDSEVKYVCLEPYSSTTTDGIFLFSSSKSSFGINNFNVYDDQYATTPTSYSLATGNPIVDTTSATFSHDFIIVFQDMECADKIIPS